MKKLLIITQKVDKDDPILSFFHRWIEAFFQANIHPLVICLEKGRSELPDEIQVVSLGKEAGRSRIKYVWRFFKTIWKHRKEYDQVFVHMNQEYVLVGGLLWRLLGKRIFLWRNHKQGNILTRLAVLFAHTVFCTSPDSFTARFKKTILMPVGVDTDTFKPAGGGGHMPHSILCIGRISRVKHIEILIDALTKLDFAGQAFIATVAGVPVSNADIRYKRELLNQSRELIEKGMLAFNSGVPHDQTPEFYNNHQISINLTSSGSFDKTIIEACACGAIAIFSNASIARDIDQELKDLCLFNEGDVDDLVKKIQAIWTLPPQRIVEIRQSVRDFAVSKHSLAALVERLGFLMGTFS